MKIYDYLIVGAGLFGATLADSLTKKYGHSVLVVEKNSNVGGMCYTEKNLGITVHKYGAHIFRTDDIDIWNYVNKLVKFRPFINSPLAYVDGSLYNLPFNMNTFKQLWGVLTPDDAMAKIQADCVANDNPQNLEEFALSKVGRTIYSMFIKDYTEKQWGKKCTELPASILGRLPLRFTYDNNYYANKQYQGIPVEGYTVLIERMLNMSTVILNCKDWKQYKDYANQIIYTGSIDEYYDYKYGKLDYRSLRFEEHIREIENVRGNAVINYTTKEYPYTREIEHKHFLNEQSPVSIVSYEYPELYNGENERYYPLETKENIELYNKYSSIETDTIFAGRLGQYRYTDMEQTIVNALNLSSNLKCGNFKKEDKI